ncbi:bifunctional phosphopantothenoylcysteine decarboxylase/phosphopantothenate synthase [Acetobacter sp.]|jgi:phosphopantothenoylcysteine decarboxylase/phosphopantothenate--cysteine ligase|uniref:bifunctional phosphopantothenoylcysteine decarboxylase/phosphopantothenate synthase n=1 Tax=Acetobacter sp. TaxID=440 RepID=UPI0025BE0151|nr:bifunctional phosphopantothenoylcysteine decarboxylase/phosphopantothenate synthase [Acetobacter sp.]MCH4090677.1 bifunctional phosphopantothenoylcysteine decarboxylase/phosphopantothenate synthase [Acetobacter sp.]MCI1300120.1 bifunctional phosphopantothenoylcysteine decarboxylase/phosphopantothenate synthase [Acetobacter sp.]MCI1316538.1 bifunctional phosphopantothenoylcysteine decarboxylase/phosphopantothenate synthase [Acetobacter sp.]
MTAATTQARPPRRVLLIVSGGIAAYKALELVRLLKTAGIGVRCVLTRAASEFVTPLSLQALSGEPVHQDLFSLTDEQEMGHISLSRSADLVVVAPATANILAKMASGLTDDLASTLLLATDTPVMVAPAMNVRMWDHPATRTNMDTLRQRGVVVVGPDEGEMACGEYGPGRLVEPTVLRDAILAHLETLSSGKYASSAVPTQPPDTSAVSLRNGYLSHRVQNDVAPEISSHWRPLIGKHALVTAGPTHEPIDPVRYLGNRSSGLQGYAIAGALADLGAQVTLISGPTSLLAPSNVSLIRVETAQQMEAAVMGSLPADIAVCTAAVADWRVAVPVSSKIKKQAGSPPPTLVLEPNPDILASISRPGPSRPSLVIGFAAETDDVEANAIAKRQRKGCDWIVANDVSTGTNVMGGTENTVILITEDGVEHWPLMAKTTLALNLARCIALRFGAPALANSEEGRA